MINHSIDKYGSKYSIPKIDKPEEKPVYPTGCCLFITDIFSSIQGESTDSGLPCTFIRFYGCPVNCSMCDTPQKPSESRRISIEHVIDRVITLRVPNVCITGGEPLVQKKLLYPLVYELLYNKFNVSIETSGCFALDPAPYSRSYKYVMDVKCPSSGVSHKNVIENLKVLHFEDEIKFVIGNREDYEFARNFISSHKIISKILFSPVFKDGNPVIGKELVDWILQDRLYQVRVQIQMHKIIGVL